MDPAPSELDDLDDRPRPRCHGAFTPLVTHHGASPVCRSRLRRLFRVRCDRA